MWYSLKQSSTSANVSTATGAHSAGQARAVARFRERCCLSCYTVARRGPSVFAIRPGVTLLEVIFSIGVILIGLVGLLSVLPLAGSRARNSVALNTSTALADAAFDQLVAGGYLNPAMLIRVGAPGTAVSLQESICIDPALAATHFANPLTFTHGYLPANFPHFQPNYTPQRDPSHSDSLSGPTGQPRLVRVGVRRYAPGTSVGTPLNLEESLRLVDSHDDVPTERPKDRTLNAYVRGYPAVQTANPNDRLAYGKRLVTGEYSWIATLNPLSGRPNERFGMLSVVVIRNRDRGFVYPDNPTTPASIPDANANSERLAIVSNPLGFRGGAGGLVTLTGSARMAGTVNENHWVMLSRLDPAMGGQPARYVHRWYRVASTDGDPIVDTSDEEHPTWQRRVYLDGSDWRFQDDNLPPNPIPAYATIVEGVVSVTERVVRIRD